MNRIFYLITGMLLMGFPLLAQTAYVDLNATGNNDGTSWENAYTSLTDALANTSEGDIWVAAGTYLPGSDTSDVFTIPDGVALYGGFAGTESTIDGRDVVANPTILSGDLNGDDVAGDFDNNRDDNSTHVIYIDSLYAAPVIIDGFTISGGQTNSTNDLDQFFYSGGGLFALSQAEVRNCTFTGNSGRTGGSVYMEGFNTSGSRFDNNVFDNNNSNSQAAGILVSNTSDIEITNSIFSNNATNRGCVYPLYCTDVLISGCSFTENVNDGGFSAAIFIWQSTNLVVEGTEFIGNSASSAGCVYLDHREVGPEADQMVLFNNCIFSGNSVTNFGAGIYNWQGSNLAITNSSFTENSAASAGGIYCDQRNVVGTDPAYILVDNCEFNDNTTTNYGGSGAYFFNASFTVSNSSFDGNDAPNSAPAMYVGGENQAYLIDNCEFTNNSSSFAGGIADYCGLGSGMVTNSLFRGNTAGNGGGAFSVGFLGNTTFDNCIFQENVAGYGGAIFVQNDSSALTVLNSEFYTNTADGSGGGAILNNSGNEVLIDNCLFEANQAETGGAVGITEDSLNLSVFTLRNSFFNFNLAQDQGGALNISDAETVIQSCVFLNNGAGGSGTGGAISLNSTSFGEVADLQAYITNSTFVDNNGDLAAGIANWTDGIATSSLYLQNNIFSNPSGDNYAIEEGTPEVFSNGGNLDAQGLQADVFDNALDLIGGDPLFVNINMFDLHLQEGSPCINAGVDEGAPATDLDGNPRVGQVDIGAYEFQDEVGVQEQPVVDLQQFRLYPNPVRDVARLRMDNNWSGELTAILFSLSGQQMATFTLEKNSQRQEWPMPVQRLQRGAYKLIITDGKRALAARLLKF